MVIFLAATATWIGMYNRDGDNVYHWVDGSPVVYGYCVTNTCTQVQIKKGLH